jgi:peptide/nickel transport system substrate-binding protein
MNKGKTNRQLRGWQHLLCLLLLGLLFSACTRKEPLQRSPVDYRQGGPSAFGDTIILGSIGDASSMIPNITGDSASHEIGGFIYNGLVKYDKDFNIVGDLAESWEIPKDELSITFHLRKGVKWHDGKEFTAHDVLFTYHFMIDPKTPTPYAGDFLLVKKAEILDRYTFRISYEKPFAPALISWGMWILPRHLLEGKDVRTSPLNRRPVGTGPYLFRQWKTGEKIELEANPNYFEGRPYTQKVLYRIIPDSATLFLELKSGGADWTGLSPMQYQRQTDTEEFRENFRKYKYLSSGYTYLGFNLKDSRFRDKRVRQALAYAIDKEEIIKVVLLGLGVEATGPYKPDTWVYNPRVKRYPHDPERAKQLLAEAGWKDLDGDGIVEKDGVPFRFTILTNQGNEERKMTAEIIQKRLETVGVKAEIRIAEWASFINFFIKNRRFETVLLGWSTGQDPDLYEIWHSSKTLPDEFNFVSYQNPEVDRFIEEGRHTFDKKRRKAYYDRIQEILAEDVPYLFLYTPFSLPVIHARFKGIEPAPTGISYNFIKWYVPKDQQRYKQ